MGSNSLGASETLLRRKRRFQSRCVALPRKHSGALESELLPAAQKELHMPGTVLYERNAHIATITYNRPEALNAINGELRADLNGAWVQFRDDEEAWVAIVTGAGRAFSAGADLRGGGAGDASKGTFWEVPGMTSLENGL